MYQENEDDWKILKEYKQKKRNKVSENRQTYQKVARKAEAEMPQLSAQIQTQEATNTRLFTRLKADQHQVDLENKKERLQDLQDDIEKAHTLEAECAKEIDKLNAEIDTIDRKIKDIRAAEHEKKKKTANKKKKAPVQKCPKKCRIDSVKMSCSHKRSIEIPPYEGEMPTLHVVSGSNDKRGDVIEIDFGGSCDHGKSQTAPDSEKHTLVERLAGSDKYCPRAKVKGVTVTTDVDRPSKLKFAASTEKPTLGDNQLKFLLDKLVFGGTEDDTCDYDISFSSCKGDLPYKAKVVAHPYRSWDLSLKVGYTSTNEIRRTKAKFGSKGKYKDYNSIESKGEWKVEIDASYEYDVEKYAYAKSFNLTKLNEELGRGWALLNKFAEFFNPINGFFEGALESAVGADDKTDNKLKDLKKRDRVVSTATLGKVEVLWPKIDIAGEYKATELKNLPKVGGVGKLVLGFAPLFGLNGELDILQLLLQTYGGKFGKYLGKIADMSYGTYDEQGKLDETQDHVKTTLTLKLKAETAISGKVGFQYTEDKGVTSSTDDTGVSGHVGIGLAGEASLKAQKWEVKFAAGAMFKTTDEDGKNQPGLKIDYKPVIIANKKSWVGNFTFTGLVIVWSVYSKLGREGEDFEENQGKMKVEDAWSNDTQVGAEVGLKKIEVDIKHERKAVLFSKRELYTTDDAVPIGS